jgi:hypothetical protein
MSVPGVSLLKSWVTLGAITLNATYHVWAPFPSPANGFNQTMEFETDGTHWIETFRSSGDIPN